MSGVPVFATGPFDNWLLWTFGASAAVLISLVVWVAIDLGVI